jgi:hypothetical protein
MKTYKTQKEKKEITRKLIDYEIEFYNSLGNKPAFEKFMDEFLNRVDVEKEIEKFPVINPIYKKAFDIEDIPDYEKHNVWESTWVGEHFTDQYIPMYVPEKKIEALELAHAKFDILLYDFMESAEKLSFLSKKSLFLKKFKHKIFKNGLLWVTRESALFSIVSSYRARMNEFAEKYPELLN